MTPQKHHVSTASNNCKEKVVVLVVLPSQCLDTFEAALYTCNKCKSRHYTNKMIQKTTQQHSPYFDQKLGRAPIQYPGLITMLKSPHKETLQKSISQRNSKTSWQYISEPRPLTSISTKGSAISNSAVNHNRDLPPVLFDLAKF